MGRMSDLHIQMTEDGFFDEQNDPSPDEMNNFVDNKDLSDKDDISIDDFSHNIKEFVDNYNQLLDTIDILQYQLKEAIDEIGDHC